MDDARDEGNRAGLEGRGKPALQCINLRLVSIARKSDPAIEAGLCWSVQQCSCYRRRSYDETASDRRPSLWQRLPNPPEGPRWNSTTRSLPDRRPERLDQNGPIHPVILAIARRSSFDASGLSRLLWNRTLFNLAQARPFAFQTRSGLRCRLLASVRPRPGPTEQ